MSTKRGNILRVCSGIKEKLDKIIEQEKQRGIEKCSYYDASCLLDKRINLSGGLKE